MGAAGAIGAEALRNSRVFKAVDAVAESMSALGWRAQPHGRGRGQ